MFSFFQKLTFTISQRKFGIYPSFSSGPRIVDSKKKEEIKEMLKERFLPRFNPITVKKHSGLQKDILSLYRDLFRTMRKKVKDPQVRLDQESKLRSLFKERSKSIKKTDIQTIEVLLTLGKRQLETFKKADTISLI